MLSFIRMLFIIYVIEDRFHLVQTQHSSHLLYFIKVIHFWYL